MKNIQLVIEDDLKKKKDWLSRKWTWKKLIEHAVEDIFLKEYKGKSITEVDQEQIN